MLASGKYRAYIIGGNEWVAPGDIVSKDHEDSRFIWLVEEINADGIKFSKKSVEVSFYIGDSNKSLEAIQ